MKTTVWVFGMVLCLVVGSVSAAIFQDDFTRPDSTDLGNGWNEGSSLGWQSWPGHDEPSPDAAISFGQVVFSRTGGGAASASCLISRSVPLNPLIQADLLMPSLTASSWTDISLYGGNSTTGRFIYVAGYNNSDGTFSIGLYNSQDGTWNQSSNWAYGPASVTNPGELRVRLTVDASGNAAVEAVKKSDQSVFWSWSGTNADLATGMDSINLGIQWNGFWNNSTITPSVDNVMATPEPATLSLMGMALLAMLKRRK
jgi:hypothetical protein